MSATITGVCGLSWEVTMAVLPRLYLKEVLLELQRRKIAVGRDKTLQKQELTHLLQEVMVCEYEQLQQHLKGKISEEPSPQTRARDVMTSDGQGAPYVQNHHGNTSQCSPHQEMVSPISSEAQQNVQAQTRAKNTLQGNLMTGTQVSNTTQSVVQNSQNQAVEPTSHATTVTQQNLRTELEAQFAQSRAKNTLQGIPSHRAQGVVQNSPHQVVKTISHMTAMQQNLQAQLAQAVAEYKQNLPRMKPSSYTGPPHTSAPVHGNSFTIGQSERLQMQVSPQIQQSPQAMPPQPTQVIRNGLAEIAKLPNLPAKLLPADENTLGKSPSSLVSQTSPQLPPQSQTVAQGGLLIQDRSSSSGMQRQSEVVLPQGLHKGVATNGVRSNTASSMAQSSPNQLVQGVSLKPAGQQPSTGTQLTQREANNALPGTRMPGSIHKEQGNMFKNSVSNSNTQTLQAFSMHENTSPYVVGQGNLMIESTEARNMKPSHQDVQGTLYNSDTTRDVSFQSAETEKDGYTDKSSTHTPTQTTLASQQMLLAPNQQLGSENFSRTDSTMQQSPGQDFSQSTLHGKSSVQDTSETKNTNNSLPANVVVKVERDDDFWPVSCTTSAANNDNSGIPESPSTVVKTEIDDSAETGSTLPVDYSVRMEESTARTDNNMEGEFREDYASPGHSPVSSLTPIQHTMPQNFFMTPTDQHDPTAISVPTLPLTEPLSVGTSLSQENGYGSTGFPSPDVTAYVSRVSMVSTRQYQAQKRKTVRALLDDLKRAKQLKTDGLTDEDDPMGIVSAMRDRREVRRNESRTNRGADVHVGPSVQPVLVQQQRTGNMQVQQEGLAPQFPMAAVSNCTFICTNVGMRSVLVQQQITGNMQVQQEGLTPQFPMAPVEANRKVPGFRAATLHKCMFCPFETRLKTNLQYHLRDHADINVYRCGKCSFSAATKQTLDNHAATQHHEELPFMCGVCGYRTGVKDNLSTHMWVVHRAGKGFQCSLCDYRTSYKSRLETHMINHHF
ncbi:PREDICTED: uncharacterized protein LOC109467267 [Branchiostoma belcheri]|uniref:Uncharacterized protein LOC109467267 n=1 Tax=Branchiostoma belcheri TaxID=7741 RepID=A0A6P4YU33_BRABE|nr:PREDICTED: uncharacterized protein LOC109467267 [Branchiostoma belcheri]